MPMIASAATTFRKLSPMKATVTAISASSGIARPAFPIAIASPSPLPR